MALGSPRLSVSLLAAFDDAEGLLKGGEGSREYFGSLLSFESPSFAG